MTESLTYTVTYQDSNPVAAVAEPATAWLLLSVCVFGALVLWWRRA